MLHRLLDGVLQTSTCMVTDMSRLHTLELGALLCTHVFVTTRQFATLQLAQRAIKRRSGKNHIVARLGTDHYGIGATLNLRVESYDVVHVRLGAVSSENLCVSMHEQ